MKLWTVKLISNKTFCTQIFSTQWCLLLAGIFLENMFLICGLTSYQQLENSIPFCWWVCPNPWTDEIHDFPGICALSMAWFLLVLIGIPWIKKDSTKKLKTLNVHCGRTGKLRLYFPINIKLILATNWNAGICDFKGIKVNKFAILNTLHNSVYIF